MANKKTPGVAKKKVNWKKYLAAVCDDVDTDYLADLFQI